MARARNIKPGFFKNEELAQCEPMARILFAGLWCLADREGRLEDRPQRIKAEILPYDDADINDLLAALAAGGFIVRYVVGLTRCIWIPTFKLHQNPHKNEAISNLPDPAITGAIRSITGVIPRTSEDAPRISEAAPEISRVSQCGDVSAVVSLQKNPELSGATSEKLGSTPADSLSSDSLSSDSLFPKSVAVGDHLVPLDPRSDYEGSPEHLSREFANLYVGTYRNHHNPDDTTKSFAELLRLGISPKTILSEIKAKARDRTESFGELKKRILPPPGRGSPTQSPRKREVLSAEETERELAKILGG